jgi:hypothetical protein
MSIDRFIIDINYKLSTHHPNITHHPSRQQRKYIKLFIESFGQCCIAFATYLPFHPIIKSIHFNKYEDHSSIKQRLVSYIIISTVYTLEVPKYTDQYIEEFELRNNIEYTVNSETRSFYCSYSHSSEHTSHGRLLLSDRSYLINPLTPTMNLRSSTIQQRSSASLITPSTPTNNNSNNNTTTSPTRLTTLSPATPTLTRSQRKRRVQQQHSSLKRNKNKNNNNIIIQEHINNEKDISSSSHDENIRRRNEDDESSDNNNNNFNNNNILIQNINIQQLLVT